MHFYPQSREGIDVLVPSVQGRHLVKAVDVSRTLSISYLAHTEPLTTNPVQLQLYDNAMETLNLESEILHKKVCISLPKTRCFGANPVRGATRTVLHQLRTCNTKRRLNTSLQL